MILMALAAVVLCGSFASCSKDDDDVIPANDDKAYDASITARIDSIGKPHLVTCSASVDGKRLTLQFRQTYTKNEYSDTELPKEEDFTI